MLIGRATKRWWRCLLNHQQSFLIFHFWNGQLTEMTISNHLRKMTSMTSSVPLISRKKSEKLFWIRSLIHYFQNSSSLFPVMPLLGETTYNKAFKGFKVGAIPDGTQRKPVIKAISSLCKLYFFLIGCLRKYRLSWPVSITYKGRVWRPKTQMALPIQRRGGGRRGKEVTSKSILRLMFKFVCFMFCFQ